jgi:hypothetical protein
LLCLYLDTMDQRQDCVAAGYLTVPRGQVTKLTAPAKDTASSTQTLNCRLMFQVATQGDTLRVTLTTGSYITDCDVALEIQMDRNDVSVLYMQYLVLDLLEWHKRGQTGYLLLDL